MWERDNFFSCAPASIRPKTDALACGAATAEATIYINDTVTADPAGNFYGATVTLPPDVTLGESTTASLSLPFAVFS